MPRPSPGSTVDPWTTAPPRGDARGLGLRGGLLLLTAGLAVSPPVCEDFDRHRIAGEVRERRRRQQERRVRAAG